LFLILIFFYTEASFSLLRTVTCFIPKIISGGGSLSEPAFVFNPEILKKIGPDPRKLHLFQGPKPIVISQLYRHILSCIIDVNPVGTVYVVVERDGEYTTRYSYSTIVRSTKSLFNTVHIDL